MASGAKNQRNRTNSNLSVTYYGRLKHKVSLKYVQAFRKKSGKHQCNRSIYRCANLYFPLVNLEGGNKNLSEFEVSIFRKKRCIKMSKFLQNDNADALQCLTLSQTTNFRLFPTESIYRQQFQI